MGDIFPACRLMLLKSETDRPYLGLPEEVRSFALREVRAPFILAEVYNELCQTCQKEMPTFNALFKRIEADPDLRGRLKMIGLSVGSSNRAVVRFRRTRGVLFPLFADRRREVFECLGRPGLPVVYLLKRVGDNGFRIVMIHSGHVRSAASMLDLVKETIQSSAGPDG